MENLILFRSLSSSLSESEYKSFVLQILNQNKCSQDMFSSMIFQHFYQMLLKPPTHQQQHLSIQNMNDIISNIIEQRKPKIDTNTDYETDCHSIDDHQIKITIDQIPQALIREIASFLCIKSYSKFECCCRTIFISSRSPPSLHTVDFSSNFWRYLKKVNNINKQQLIIRKVSNVNTLTVHERNIDYIKLNHKYPKVTRLGIYCDIKRTDFEHLFPWENIKNLTISTDGQPLFEWSIFDIISKCENLQFLETACYGDCEFEGEQWINDLLQLEFIRKLKGLSVVICLAMNPILTGVCNTLESLHIDNDNYDIFDNCHKWNNLKEVCFLCCFPSQILSIVNNSKNLQRFSMDDAGDEFMDDVDEVKDVLYALFKIESLSYFAFSGDYGLLSLITDILRVRLPMIHKKRLKIDLKCFGVDIKDMQLKLVTLINTLNTWCSHGFMIRINYYLKSDDKEEERLKVFGVWLKHISRQFTVENELQGKHKHVAISNKNHSFNDFTERWIMCCDNCV